jgi:uncharacterized phage-like protein YoqJ
MNIVNKDLLKVIAELLSTGEPNNFVLWTSNSTLTHNGNAVMGRGIAKKLADLYPILKTKEGDALKKQDFIKFSVDKFGNRVEIRNPKLHSVHRLESSLGSIRFGAFPVKYGYWEDADLSIIRDNAESLRDLALNHPYMKFHMNFPGIGAGHLERSKVLPILEEQFDDVENVYIYEYNEGGKPTILIKNLRKDNPFPPEMLVAIGRGTVDFRVDRESPVGNPFPMKLETEREQVCEKYEQYFSKQMLDETSELHKYVTLMEKVYNEGDNINLWCWCAPLRCHAETIKKYIERKGSATKRKVTLSFTGHRPEKLDNTVKITEMYKRLLAKWSEKYDLTIVVGGARGIDSIVGLVAAKMGLPVTLALPFIGCNPTDNNELMKYSNVTVVHVSEKPYTDNSQYQKRNTWMVDHSDILIAYWDGTPGGTANTVRYAEKIRKPMKNLFGRE